MSPREIVRAQIEHRETDPVPYTLGMEPEVAARLDAYFGHPGWRERLIPYLVQCGSLVRIPEERLDPAHVRDAFGTVWRTDRLPRVVVEPGLKQPTLTGYRFPPVEAFLDPALKDQVRQRVAAHPHAFTVVTPTICLWQSWYVRGFEETLVDSVAEP
ncbi:MAG: hypothetical protein QHJ73_02475, partial [Armatimonadota bacterium]|nr:hypothetical protein [Armatimonadota bacterium]